MTILTVFTYYDSNQQMHTVLLKSQHYNTPAPTCFRYQWPSSGSTQLYTTVA